MVFWINPAENIDSPKLMEFISLNLLVQKCGDAINTQQARRSKRNKIGDMLGFNTGPVDSKNPTACQSILLAIDKERKFYQ